MSTKYELRQLLFKHCKLVSSSWTDEWKNSVSSMAPDRSIMVGIFLLHALMQP